MSPLLSGIRFLFAHNIWPIWFNSTINYLISYPCLLLLDALVGLNYISLVAQAVLHVYLLTCIVLLAAANAHVYRRVGQVDYALVRLVRADGVVQRLAWVFGLVSSAQFGAAFVLLVGGHVVCDVLLAYYTMSLWNIIMRLLQLNAFLIDLADLEARLRHHEGRRVV